MGILHLHNLNDSCYNVRHQTLLLVFKYANLDLTNNSLQFLQIFETPGGTLGVTLYVTPKSGNRYMEIHVIGKILRIK